VPADSVSLQDAPELVGLSFRHIRGADDADDLLDVRARSVIHDAIDPLSTSESTPSRDQRATALSEAAALGQQDRWLVAQVGQAAVGYSRLGFWPEADGTWVYLTLGWLTPEWRGLGSGTAMLHGTEDRLRRLAAVEHASERCEFAANASSTEDEATALLVCEGYRPAYTVLEMGLDTSIPLQAPTAPPAGIEVRPVAVEHLPLIALSVHAAYEQEYAGGRYGEVFDAGEYVASWLSPTHDPTLWQVAWDGARVAGQVMAVIEKGRAEVFEVSVPPEWRRQGLARALLLRALRILRDRGVAVIRLHTNAAFRTRARDLYESVGFRVLKEFPRYRKPFDRCG
jgi:mycothiol synthase